MTVLRIGDAPSELEDAGLGPAFRRLTMRFSVSNQNVEPSDAASPVNIQPPSMQSSVGTL